MIRTLCVATLLAACAPAVLRAQDDAPSCEEPRTQTDMNICAGIAFQAADSVLNQVYPRVIAGLDSARVPLLREAQRQWIRLRDADCALEAAEFEGGSMQPMIHSFCRADRTRERVVYLRTLLAAETGEADERGAVIQATEALFAAMRTRDTAALRTLMHPRAQIVAVRDGRVSVRSAAEWIGGLSLTAGELIERMWDPRVQVDGDLATLWAPYDFHVGERFSHCGMDAFQFVRVEGAWKMITVTFTGRTTGCEGAP
ncbi:lysozyme inhibitor LprI family protein [Longimicrobium sp.]|uniref:lysozyme inhibitor LprI family protein n=1 Tax=Longimicrobium sp. TaxID=2029185 RepID=UPI003B39FAAF